MANKQEFLKKIKNEKNILIYKDYFFKELNTFKINYLIETLIIPKSVYALKKVINYAIEYEIPYVIVGNGSKILFQTHYVKKVVILLIIATTYRIDLIGQTMAKDVVMLFFIGREGLSILENAANCGLPIPQKLKDTLAQFTETKNKK